jgi:hypothetical protein
MVRTEELEDRGGSGTGVACKAEDLAGQIERVGGATREPFSG